MDEIWSAITCNEKVININDNYSYLVAHFAFLSQTQGSALEGEKPKSNVMTWFFWDPLRPELFSPYSALYIINICPSSSSNSRPETMYSFSLVFASKYTLPLSAPQTSRLFSLAKNMTNLRDLVETTPEYMLSIGSGVRCPPGTNPALCLPSCLTAKMRWTLIFWYPFGALDTFLYLGSYWAFPWS